MGTLVTVPGSPCIQVKPLGRPAVALLWPPGFTASSTPLRIYDQKGSEVAAEGDTVTVSGGGSDKPSSYCRTQGYFEVDQVTRGEPSFAP